MITAKGDKLVFLLGLPRSGTTLLSVMLNNHPEVRCPPEPWLMLALASLGKTSAHDPSDAPVLQRAFRQFCDGDASIELARHYAMSAYNRCLISARKTILIDKTPRYYLILPYLEKIFPRARYIFLWRDPLDVAASIKEAWGFDLPRLLARGDDHLVCMDYIVGLQRLHAFSQKLETSRFHSLRYEDLVTKPAETMKELFHWLDVPEAEDCHRFALGGSEFESSFYGDRKILATGEPHPNSIGNWKEVFTAADAERLGRFVGQRLLSKMSYGRPIENFNGDDEAKEHFQRLERSLAVRRNEYEGSESYAALRIEERRVGEALVNGQTDPVLDLVGFLRHAADLSELSPTAELNHLRKEIADLKEQAARERAEATTQAAAHGKLLEDALIRERERIAELERAAALAAEQASIIETAQTKERANALELENTKSIVTELTMSVAARTGEIQSLGDELDGAKSVNAELRATVGMIQESLAARVREAVDLVARLQESAETRAALDRELQEQRAAATRFSWKWERARRCLTHVQATSYRRAMELESQIQSSRQELAGERARSGGLQKLVDDTRNSSRVSQQQFELQLAEKSKAIETLVNATHELNTRLRMLLTSRLMRFGWKVGLGSVPYWDDPARDELTGVAEKCFELSKNNETPVAPTGDEMDRALQHLVDKGFRPGVVLDIGAAKGYWTEKAAWRWPAARFFMLDPLVESEESLKRICREPRFQYLLTAAGKEPGEMTMNLTDDFDGSTLLAFPIPHRQRRVPVATIDDLLTQGKIEPPDLVKIDVQGFELNVMDGGKRLFESAEVLMLEVSLFRFMENCPRVDEIIRYMADRNYYLFDLAGLLRRPFEDDLGQMDLVFVSQRSPMVGSNRWF